ncbi:hypothetical protein niasHT_013261 [Heterodera trifolii]|uniref:Guanylate cyclase domain-containing protein n=1 Tax=Heterodera trifolii TaxID=157864 RepID=A0ABD2LBF6_9BILA
MDVGFWLTLLLLFSICLLCRLHKYFAQIRPAPNQQGDEGQGDWDDNDGANQQGPEDEEANDEDLILSLELNLQQQNLDLTQNILLSILAKFNSLDVRKNIDMAEPELQFREIYDSILFADISGFTNLASLCSSPDLDLTQNILLSILAKFNSLDVRKNIDMAEPELQFREIYDSILFADISGFTNLASLCSSPDLDLTQNILLSILAKFNSLDVRKNIDMAEPELQFREIYDSILFADISGFTNLASLCSSPDLDLTQNILLSILAKFNSLDVRKNIDMAEPELQFREIYDSILFADISGFTNLASLCSSPDLDLTQNILLSILAKFNSLDVRKNIDMAEPELQFREIYDSILFADISGFTNLASLCSSPDLDLTQNILLSILAKFNSLDVRKNIDMAEPELQFREIYDSILFADISGFTNLASLCSSPDLSFFHSGFDAEHFAVHFGQINSLDVRKNIDMAEPELQFREIYDSILFADISGFTNLASLCSSPDLDLTQNILLSILAKFNSLDVRKNIDMAEPELQFREIYDSILFADISGFTNLASLCSSPDLDLTQNILLSILAKFNSLDVRKNIDMAEPELQFREIYDSILFADISGFTNLASLCSSPDLDLTQNILLSILAKFNSLDVRKNIDMAEPELQFLEIYIFLLILFPFHFPNLAFSHSFFYQKPTNQSLTELLQLVVRRREAGPLIRLESPKAEDESDGEKHGKQQQKATLAPRAAADKNTRGGEAASLLLLLLLLYCACTSSTESDPTSFHLANSGKCAND